MSASKGRREEGMFHIQYPAVKDFWSWTELGCLARALGFPTDLIRQNVTEEVETEEDGMYLQQLNRMVELKLLNSTLHRSFNMHTADWNLCVIRKAARLLNLSVLSFEELHNIRVAYATYEAGDMKGLLLDQRTLLRTLKMCHRVISPKKLMHRVKHMKSRLEEANRIQLYEFLDLILWCDYMEQYQGAHKVGEAEGKEKDLYNLVDFESLLSHQDQRRSRALDQRYLAEEWDFGREQLGSKHMFKGEVVYTDQRIKQTRSQKKNYRGLKKAVGQSQRRVYRAHAGSIRQRPISAPDLSMYSTPRGTPRARTTSAAAMFQSVQRRLTSPSSREANSRMDFSDRPALPEYVRAHTPSVVTSQDLDEASLKMKMLQFDIITLETRCEVKRDEEMNFYIPEYQHPAKEDNSDGAQKGDGKRAEHWTPEIIDKLTYPPYHLPTHHAHTCDARFRGWKPADHRGRQRILTAPTFDSSPHGQLLAHQRSAMLAPVTRLHRDYVVRYTSRKQATQQQRAKRPCTAPTPSPRAKPLKRLGCRSAGHPSRKHDDDESTVTSGTPDVLDDPQTDEDLRNDRSAQGAAQVSKSYPDPYGKYGQDSARNSTSKSSGSRSEERDLQGSSSTPNTSGPASSRHQAAADLPPSAEDVGSGDKEEKVLPQVSVKNAPSRRHAGSKVVDMGLIGTITLLESIQEHETEDRLTSTLSTTSSRPSSPDQRPVTPGGPPGGLRQDNLDTSIPAGWSRRPQSPGNARHRAHADTDSLQAGERRRMENGASAVPYSDQVSKEVPSGSDSRSVRPGQSEGGLHKPATRNSQDQQQTRSSEKPSSQNYDPSSGAKGEPSVGADHRRSANLRKPRVSSAASSTRSDGSDPREAHTPLTSVTITIKNNNNNQRVTSTRAFNDVDAEEGNTPSPIGFKRYSPCVTSTPRRKRSSPTSNVPRHQQIRDAGPAVGKSFQASRDPNPSQSDDRRPESAGKALGRKNLSLLQAETDEESHLSWVQDQILAMNSACERTALDDQPDKDPEEPYDGGFPPEEEAAELGEEKKTMIRFNREQAFQEQREAAHREYLARRKASEGVLKLKNYDLDSETARRFIFNKATTRRLLHRVQDVISPELKTRIRTGNTGLKVN